VRVLLVAHAATRDGVLPAAARSRVAELGRLLPRARAAFSSPAQAARETAAALGLAVTLDDALADPARVSEWLAGQQLAEGTRTAVTHPDVIRAAVVLALGAPAASSSLIDVPPLAVTELTPRDGRWRLAHVNWEPALFHVPHRRARRRAGDGSA
jgi:broad specificity phosphatase PhoE